jgi:hypothetical protein
MPDRHHSRYGDQTSTNIGCHHMTITIAIAILIREGQSLVDLGAALAQGRSM